MLKKLLACAVLFLFCSCTLVVNTEPKEKKAEFNAAPIYNSIFVLNVKNKDNGELVGICSGFAVSNKLLITAGHCGVAYYELLSLGAITEELFIEYYAPDGETTETLGDVKLVAVDSFNDIAVLERPHHGLIPLKIAKDTPKPHEKVWVVGSPMTFLATSYGGEVIKSHYDLNALYRDKLLISAFAVGGNSGSCVVNENYEVIGILVAGWHGVGNVNIVTSSKYLTTLLKLMAEEE